MFGLLSKYDQWPTTMQGTNSSMPKPGANRVMIVLRVFDTVPLDAMLPFLLSRCASRGVTPPCSSAHVQLCTRQLHVGQRRCSFTAALRSLFRRVLPLLLRLLLLWTYRPTRTAIRPTSTTGSLHGRHDARIRKDRSIDFISSLVTRSQTKTRPGEAVIHEFQRPTA